MSPSAHHDASDFHSQIHFVITPLKLQKWLSSFLHPCWKRSKITITPWRWNLWPFIRCNAIFTVRCRSPKIIWEPMNISEPMVNWKLQEIQWSSNTNREFVDHLFIYCRDCQKLHWQIPNKLLFVARFFWANFFSSVAMHLLISA